MSSGSYNIRTAYREGSRAPLVTLEWEMDDGSQFSLTLPTQAARHLGRGMIEAADQSEREAAAG
ncbi:hypothetical protein [Streptomyces sp. NPDC059003]|uniref:hypothetical protein n=1 Tax=Streptomyces sp. NPDC059003 TaxID=3346691 RepID=UPI0036CB6BB5